MESRPTRPSPLFRAAALAASRNKSLGEIVLISPLASRVASTAAVATAAALVAFGYWGTYTRHSTLSGQLMPNLGVVRVYAPQAGTVLEKRVAEGQIVQRGDVLYVISSERLSAAGGPTYAEIGRQLAARRLSLAAEIAKARQLERLERASVEARAAALHRERDRIAAMIRGQTERLALADDAARRYARIRTAGYVSAEQLLAKREDALDQRSRLQSLERDSAGVERQLAELDGQRASLPLKYQNQVAELERQAATVEEEISRNEAQRRIAIEAPVGGTATAVIGEVGQPADTARALLSIVPAGARLEAELWAPSRAVGFIEPGERVRLRYPAYPYQKFGHQPGRVVSVSRTALSAADLPAADALGPGAREPLYRVEVELGSQSVAAYGEARPLRSGMAVQADVLLEKRRLYEWVLAPLYTLEGQM